MLKLMTGIMFAAFLALPMVAVAGEATPSYANKKAGKVVFKSNSEEASGVAVSAQDDASDVADIEPAAGAESAAEAEISAPSKSSSLAESMKLPRK